jgi:2-polyprenyl-3-methyl-5-hydroxy-6-metoxy-1,4-benzoquinol methylase
MPQDQPFEWTSENVAAFWDFESQFPSRYFTYHNADGMIKRLSRYIADSEAILDYGCGTGLLLARLAEKGYRVAGSDTSEQSLEATRHRLQNDENFLGAFTPDALLAEGRQFDSIFAVELVEHLHDEWLDGALDNLRWLLKPDGRIIVTTPNQERLENARLMCPCCRSVFHRWQHVRAWSQTSFTDYVEQRGFRVTDAFTTDFSIVETAQERWQKLSRLKKLKKLLRGKTPKKQSPPAQLPHLVVVFQSVAQDASASDDGFASRNRRTATSISPSFARLIQHAIQLQPTADRALVSS